MESIKQTVNSGVTAVSEAVAGTSATAQKEEKKEEAKDSDKGVLERGSAAVSAAGHKKDEQVSSAKQENAQNSM